MLRGEIVGTGGRVWLAVQIVAGACGAWAAATPAAALAAPDLDAASASVPVPAVPELVTAGDVVRLEWPELPQAADEFEVLLSLDGGATYPVRLTPQLAPGTTTLTWTVPNLPTSDARVRLRAGFDGDEVEGAPSRSFRLLSRADLPPASLRWSEGEWWTSVGASAWSVTLTPVAEELEPAPAASALEQGALAPPTQLPPPPPPAARPQAARTGASGPPAAPASARRAPRSSPQRE